MAFPMLILPPISRSPVQCKNVPYKGRYHSVERPAPEPERTPAPKQKFNKELYFKVREAILSN
jgi:hypothetical protein